MNISSRVKILFCRIPVQFVYVKIEKHDYFFDYAWTIYIKEKT